MTNAPRLIGLYSSAPASGKTTIANYLNNHGYRTISFASPLKTMVRVFLREFGLHHETIDQYLFINKEYPIPEVGVSARHLCQTLGTEWGRACVHPEIWVNVWRRGVESSLKRGIDVVADDCRFPNEFRTIKELGGEIWRIERPGFVFSGSHVSEGALNHHHFDHVVTNDANLTQLYAYVRSRISA